MLDTGSVFFKWSWPNLCVPSQNKDDSNLPYTNINEDRINTTEFNVFLDIWLAVNTEKITRDNNQTISSIIR